MAGYYRKLTKYLKDNGCRYVRQADGDHELWESRNGHRFPVDYGISSRHTANEICKQAGLKKAF